MMDLAFNVPKYFNEIQTVTVTGLTGARFSSSDVTLQSTLGNNIFCEAGSDRHGVGTWDGVALKYANSITPFIPRP